jgi:hypothetical protein
LIASGAESAGSEIAADVKVSLGDGDGTFQPRKFCQIGPLSFTPVTITGAIVGDFNSDRILDIVTVGQDGVAAARAERFVTMEPRKESR